MPKVLPEYLEQRRKQILDAASACFTEHGFHQTSMQDICDRADLSPGAIYRYFKSKDEIIGAICEGAHQRDLDLIESIKARGRTRDVMDELAHIFLGSLSVDQVRLHIDMLAEAPRSSEVARPFRGGAQAINDSFAGLIRAAQERGEVNREIDADAVAKVMCALYNGYIMQQQIDAACDPAAYIRAVMQIFEGAFFSDEEAARPSAPTSAALPASTTSRASDR